MIARVTGHDIISAFDHGFVIGLVEIAPQRRRTRRVHLDRVGGQARELLAEFVYRADHLVGTRVGARDHDAGMSVRADGRQRAAGRSLRRSEGPRKKIRCRGQGLLHRRIQDG